MGSWTAGCAIWLALGGTLALAGCVQYRPLGTSARVVEPLPAAVSARYQPGPVSLRPQSETTATLRGLLVHELALPAVATESEATAAKPLTLEYYDTFKGQPTPVILLLPVLDGHLHVIRYFARYFAKHGWAAIIVRRQHETIPLALQHLETTMRHNQREYRRALNWIYANPKFDHTRVGVFGISFGGIDAVVLDAIDPRVDAVVAGMAGGSLPELFVKTSYRKVGRQVAAAVARTGLSHAELQQQLAAHLETGPLKLAPYVNRQKLFMIMTHSDWVIPFPTQHALWQALGEPRALILPTGHRTSVFYFPLLRRTAYTFFRERFHKAAG